jgi:hypothetical protein
VGRDLRRLRLVAERWPVFLVAPAFYLDGYPVWQVFVLSVMTALLTEVAFAVVRVLLLDREY